LVESIQPEEEEEQDVPAPPKEPTPVIPPSKILAMVGARELLDQVNTHVLNNRATISTGKGAIRLVWRDQHDEAVTRGIMITVQDAETILINGAPFPACSQARIDLLFEGNDQTIGNAPSARVTFNQVIES
jgi:hypothetical protein